MKLAPFTEKGEQCPVVPDIALAEQGAAAGVKGRVIPDAAVVVLPVRRDGC